MRAPPTRSRFRSRASTRAPALLMERLRDGPVPELLNPGTGSSSVWSIGGRLRTPAAGASFRQQFMAGADVEGDAARVRPAFSGMVGETLDGIPAHVWQFTAPESASRWTSTIVSAYASERIAIRSRAAFDAGVRRPHMDEIVTGFEARPTDRSFVRLSAIGRREHDLIGAVDVGVPESTYAVSFIRDAGVDLVGSQDDQLLPIYNRARSTFGADRYLVTNPSDHESSFVGADLTYQTQTEHLFLLMGATAGRSEGLSANRGFNAIENDQGVVGDVFIDPNARTYAQGRTFTERGYTLKWSGAYRFPRDATFGVVARYQDGQHFARLVIVPNLNQGPEAIRAFRNGRTRFTYTLTIDLRLQKQFTIGGCRLTGLV